MSQRDDAGEQACRWPSTAVRPVLFLAAALFCTQTSCSDALPETMLTVQQGGKQIELPVEAGGAAQALVVACEDQLSAVDGLLRLAVSAESIEALRQKETVIEIRYPTSRSFILEALGKHEIQADRLLIPLTGEFAEGEMATFFVHLGTWKPGPYRKSFGAPELRHLVENLGVLVDSN